MKKTFIIIAIVSALLAGMLVGCRAAPQVPGVTAIQSAMPTVPGMSPSPMASKPGTSITMTPGATIPMVTTPAKATAGKKTTP